MSDLYPDLPFNPDDPTMETPSERTIRYAYFVIIRKIWPDIDIDISINMIDNDVMKAVDNSYKGLVNCSGGMAFGHSILGAIIYKKPSATFRQTATSMWRAHRYNHSAEDLNTAIQQCADFINTDPNMQYTTCRTLVVNGGSHRIYGELAKNFDPMDSDFLYL